MARPGIFLNKATMGLSLDTPEKQDSYARFCVNRGRKGERAHKLATRVYLTIAWHAAEPRRGWVACYASKASSAFTAATRFSHASCFSAAVRGSWCIRT